MDFGADSTHSETQEFPWEFYDAVVTGGRLGLTVPTEYGGGGSGVTEAAIVEQEIAASGASMADAAPCTSGSSAAAEGSGALSYRGVHVDKAHFGKAVARLERADALPARAAGGQR